MCHNSGIESEQQIERYMEHGMPEKAIKSVKYTLKKRTLKQQKLQEHTDSCSNSDNEHLMIRTLPSSSSSSVAKSNIADEQANLSDCSSSSSSSGCASDASELPQAVAATIAATATTTAIAAANNSDNNLLKIPKLCGRFRKQQQQQPQQQQATPDATTAAPNQQQQQQQRKLSSMEPSMDDALAIGTQMTRKFSEQMYCLIAQLQGSRLYTILTRTTQPAHLIVICILTVVLATVGPDLIENSPQKSYQIIPGSTKTTWAARDDNDANDVGNAAGSKLATLAYLGAFSTHFGSQIWMTFVSGLSLYFSLPRHTFGQCQQILFPKYFALNAMLSISMLILYVKYFLSSWTTAAGLQLGTLALTAAIEVVVRLYLAPPMLRLMHEKYKIEGAIGSGQEVGSLVQGDLVQCPHYQRIHKSFRRIHMTIAIGNMIVLLGTCLQLYFLASKIRIS